MLALGRTLYGLRGKADGIHRLMILGSIGAMACYLIAALSTLPIVSLIACALTGLCVSLLWPGSVIVSSRHLPMAGASMFALLSAMGDAGASLASFVTGQISDAVRALPFGLASGEQAGLRAGLLFAALFCLGCLIVQKSLQRAARADLQNTRFRSDGAPL
jgi:MFS family permease